MDQEEINPGNRPRGRTHFSSNIRAISQVMMGRFFRSLYVGRMTEYLLSFLAAVPPLASAPVFFADARAMLSWPQAFSGKSGESR